MNLWSIISAPKPVKTKEFMAPRKISDEPDMDRAPELIFRAEQGNKSDQDSALTLCGGRSGAALEEFLVGPVPPVFKPGESHLGKS